MCVEVVEDDENAIGERGPSSGPCCCFVTLLPLLDNISTFNFNKMICSKITGCKWQQTAQDATDVAAADAADAGRGSRRDDSRGGSSWCRGSGEGISIIMQRNQLVEAVADAEAAAKVVAAE